MSLIPSYDPKSFSSVDLRKYHIRDIKDVIRFHEFVTSRMEECQFVLKKFSSQLATFKSVTTQLRKKQEIQQQSYGTSTVIEASQDTTPQIQSVDVPVSKQHEDLINEMKNAVAEENLIEQLHEESDEPLQAILDKYKLSYGKKGPMFYRENEKGHLKLVSKADVPEDIKQQLLNAIGKGE